VVGVRGGDGVGLWHGVKTVRSGTVARGGVAVNDVWCVGGVAHVFGVGMCAGMAARGGKTRQTGAVCGDVRQLA